MKANYNIIQDSTEAKKVWEYLSPKKTIDDEWEFRFAFFKHAPYRLHFLTGYDDGIPFGVLPLQFNPGVGLMPPYARGREPFYEIFGGDDTDDNVLLVKKGYEHFIQEFLSKVDRKTYLAPLATQYKKGEFYTHKYLLPLNGLKTYEEYLQQEWHGDARRELRRQIRKLHENNRIEVAFNRYKDIHLMFQFNIERFGEGSSFNWDYRKEIFKDLIKQFNVQTVSVLVDGKQEAVSYGIVHKNTYVSMNVGVSHKIRNLGKLLIFLQIQRAIDLGCTVFDAGKGSDTWKEDFKLQKIPQYKLLIA